MKKNILKREVQAYCKEIYEKYNVIKEIDFNEDIDIGKSDRYIVDEENGYLEFLYKEMENIKAQDITTVFGKTEINDTNIKFISTTNEVTCDIRKRSHLLIEKPIMVDEANIIYIDFEKDKESMIFFTISDSKYYEVVKKIKQGKLPFSAKTFESRNSERMTCFFQHDNVIVQKYTDNNLEIDTYAKTMHTGEAINLKIDLQDCYMKLEDEKIKIPYIQNVVGKGESYISIGHVPNDINQIANIKSIIYARKDGYIYTKVFKMHKQGNKIFVLCTGKPEIQYFSNLYKQWIDILNNEEIIGIDQDIQFRVKLQSKDKIYKFFVLSTK